MHMKINLQMSQEMSKINHQNDPATTLESFNVLRTLQQLSKKNYWYLAFFFSLLVAVNLSSCKISWVQERREIGHGSINCAEQT